MTIGTCSCCQRFTLDNSWTAQRSIVAANESANLTAFSATIRTCVELIALISCSLTIARFAKLSGGIRKLFYISWTWQWQTHIWYIASEVEHKHKCGSGCRWSAHWWPAKTVTRRLWLTQIQHWLDRSFTTSLAICHDCLGSIFLTWYRQHRQSRQPWNVALCATNKDDGRKHVTTVKLAWPSQHCVWFHASTYTTHRKKCSRCRELWVYVWTLYTEQAYVCCSCCCCCCCYAYTVARTPA